MQDGQAKLLTL